ncbi:hypothetical protein pipiens_016632 [Culex pipiens pipiens]|uniref:Uncharacterized protein n=1 Tax=Culex pipiens pipiens TaxID=38569 RepID=A0ABD1CKJ1_CULPP
MFVSKGYGVRVVPNKEFQLILSPQTMLYEIVEEFQVKVNRKIRVYALYIIEAIILGGVDVHAFSLAKRSALCTKGCHRTERAAVPPQHQPGPPGSDRHQGYGCSVERFEPRKSQRFHITLLEKGKIFGREEHGFLRGGAYHEVYCEKARVKHDYY